MILKGAFHAKRGRRERGPSSLSSRSPEASGPKRCGRGSAMDGRLPQRYGRRPAVDGGHPHCCGSGSAMNQGRPHCYGLGPAMNQVVLLRAGPAVDGGRPHCCGRGPAVDEGRPHYCGHGPAVDGRCPHCYGRDSAVDGGHPQRFGDRPSTARANPLVSSLKLLELEPLRALVRVSTHHFPSPRVSAGHCRTEKGAEAGDPSGKKTAPKSRLVRGDTHQGTRRSLTKAG
jgi:hypothetical protein